MVNVCFIDIDGTLGKNDYELLIKDEEKLSKELTELSPYPWVDSTPIFKEQNVIHFVTGRYKRHEDLTRKWLREKINCGEFTLTVLGYDNWEKYVEENVDAFRRLVVTSLFHFKQFKMIVFEDSEDVIEAIKEKSDEFPDLELEIIEVTDGIPSSVYSR